MRRRKTRFTAMDVILADAQKVIRNFEKRIALCDKAAEKPKIATEHAVNKSTLRRRYVASTSMNDILAAPQYEGLWCDPEFKRMFEATANIINRH